MSIEEATVSNMWEIAALVEVLERKGLCTKHDLLDADREVHRRLTEWQGGSRPLHPQITQSSIRIRIHATARTPDAGAAGLINRDHLATEGVHGPRAGWIVCDRRRRYSPERDLRGFVVFHSARGVFHFKGP